MGKIPQLKNNAYVQFLVFSFVSGKYLFTGRFCKQSVAYVVWFLSTAYINVRGEREIEGIAKQKGTKT